MTAVLPGLLLCTAVALLATALARAEAALFGHAWLEPLVLAILLGAAIRTAWTPGPRFKAGIAISGKLLLEIAVVLLGASLSLSLALAMGPALLLGILVLVLVACTGGYLIGRLLGLTPRMAILVACGNAICGNSAIAAVAPVIGADGRDVASSIAFTAVLGVLVVLGLPLLIPVLGLSTTQYGLLAGLTVYAVPQVLAAAAPAGMLAVQVGTLAKLLRVLMLGPVILVLSVLAPRLRQEVAPARLPFFRLVPWFILGFLAMVAARSLGLLPEPLLAVFSLVATALTVVSMAALGLGVDVRVVARAGARVTTAAVASLLGLGLVALVLIRLIG